MRKMFSKNQIAVIAKNVVDEALLNNPVLSHITFDSEELEVVIPDNDFRIGAGFSLFIDSPEFVIFSNDDTLQGKLDEKQGAISLEDETTFGVDLTNHKLYSNSKQNLTTQEETALKENMKYWILKGYIAESHSKVKINQFIYGDVDKIEIYATSVLYADNSGTIGIDTLSQFKIILDLEYHEYSLEALDI